MPGQALVSLREHIKLFGRNEAALLGQLEYWLTKANKGQNTAIIFRKGEAWVALSRKELFDQVGLSIDQGRRAMDRLKDFGVVVSEVHLVKNITRAHIQIDHGVLQSCLAASTGSNPEVISGTGNNAESGFGTDAKTGSGKNAKTYSIGKNYIKEYASASDTCSEKTDSVKPDTGKKGEKEEKKSEGKCEISLYAKFGCANPNSDVALQHSSSPITPMTSETVSYLEVLFKSAWTETHHGHCLEFTAQKRGQLKHFIEKMPDGTSGKVLDWCVRHWSDFVSWAMQNEGAFKPPQQPTPGFLLQYAQSALNSWSEFEEHKPKPVQKWVATVAQEKVPQPVEKILKYASPHLDPSHPDYDDGIIIKDLDQLAKIMGLDK